VPDLQAVPAAEFIDESPEQTLVKFVPACAVLQVEGVQELIGEYGDVSVEVYPCPFAIDSDWPKSVHPVPAPSLQGPITVPPLGGVSGKYEPPIT
jgi:hypothetical protein